MSPSPDPPLRSADDLRAKALESCAKHVEATLAGTYELEALEADVEWSPVELRNSFDQPFVVWRTYDSFEVLLDEAERVVGFVDGDKWRGCAWKELPPGAGEALARATGLVPAHLPLVGQRQGERDCLELAFAEKPSSGQLRVRVNPVRRVVISVEPLEEPR